MAESLLGLAGKVAIVTGAGRGIGQATALMLAKSGAHVVVADINAEGAQKTAAEASALGPRCVAVHADVRRQNDIRRMVHAAMDNWGRIDVGVNNVGGSVGGSSKSVMETDATDWAATVEQNLYTSVRCSQAYAKVMIEKKIAGSIVNIASPAGLRAATRLGPYGAAKAGVINLTWTLAVELAPYGIRVNVVVPAFVTTPALAGFTPPAEQEALAKRVVPMGRATRAEDVAGAILCFASPVLTSYCTGQMLVCDGGRLLTNPIFGPPGS